MTEPLFISPDIYFEKLAAETDLPEDPNTWPQEILQELYKQVPYISDFEPHVQMTKVDAEKGYGFGMVEISSQTEMQLNTPEEQQQAAGLRKARVPIIVKDGKLQPFDLMVTDQSTLIPLTESRLRRSVFRPQAFDVTSKTPGDQSMIGQLYPPYRQSYGMGGGGLAFNAGKTASALEEYLEKEAAAIDDFLKGDRQHGRTSKEWEEYEVDGEGRRKEASAAATPVQFVKTGSLLQAILPTVNETHYNALFETLNADQNLRSAFVKNAASTGESLRVLAEYDPVSANKTAGLIPSLLKPSVLQVSRVDSGYQVKSASHLFWAPTVEHLDRGDVIRRFGEKVALAADTAGSVTMADGAESQAPLEETQQAAPVSESGVYKVQDDAGKELIGYVVPNLIDLDGQPLPLALFTNGSQVAVQTDIIGMPAGDAYDLPSAEVPSGRGAFFSEMDGKIMATVPLELGGSFSGPSDPGVSVLQGETFDGRPVEVSVQPNIQQPMGTPEGRLLVPQHWKWLPLDQSQTVSLANAEEEVGAQKQAQRAMASVTVRGSGDCYTVSGFAVEKLASAEREMVDWDGAMFLLSALGVSQGYGAQKLAESRLGLEPVQVRIGRSLKLASSRIAEAKKVAQQKLASAPNLRRVLFKEAAVISDPVAVDTVLSLGFINPENITTFVSYLPLIDDAQSRMCELLLASRLGLNAVPTGALEKAVRSTEEALEGLRVLAFQG